MSPPDDFWTFFKTSPVALGTHDKALMAKLTWYGRRLRSMEIRELLWRVGRAGRSAFPDSPPVGGVAALSASEGPPNWQHALERFREGANRPVLLNRAGALAISQREPAAVAALVARADTVARNTYAYFGYPEVSLPSPTDWNYDPIANVRWPETSATRIDHRAASGDVKWIWELNRLQHLPWLAQAWLFTGDSRYSSTAFEQLDSWIEQNPPGRGIAWRGAFEAGIRAISIAVALQGLRDAPELTPVRYRRIVEVLAESAWRCWRDRSRFSSANNHLIGEMAGLATVAIMFPELELAPVWESRAVRALSIEADRQILTDGSGAEQAAGYQMFTVELLHLVATLLAQRDGEAPAAIASAISRSCAYLSAIIGQDDPDPRYGDNDDGFALRLGPEQLRTVRDHLGIVDPSRRLTEIEHSGLDAQWHFEARPRDTQSCNASPVPSAGRNYFAPDGGLVVLRSGQRRVTMDVGPLGYLSIAAHGHADALAVTVSAEGHELIGDPGTGSYYGNPHWRSVMRGTSAHATLTVDEQDQSVSGGAFLWSKRAHTTVHGVDLAAGVVDAEHDGYTRLNGHIVHRRWLVAPPEERVILIVDLISGSGIHDVRATWPLHPDLDARRIEGGHTVHREDSLVFQLLYAGTLTTSHDEVRGDSARDRGWWSECLESRSPTWWLGAKCEGRAPLAMATLITFADAAPTADLHIAKAGSHIDVAWTEASSTRCVRIDAAGSAVVGHVRLDPSVSGPI